MNAGLLFYRDTSVTNTVESVLSTTDSSDVTIRAWNIINTNPYPVYLKFYNIASTSVTVGTSTITGILMLPPNGSIFENLTAYELNSDGGLISVGGGRYLNFSSAISIACTKNLADNDNTTPLTGIYVELQFQKL